VAKAKKNERFAELAEEAEQSVAGVKDPELRRIAYQKILEDLLGGGGSSKAASNRAPGRAASASKPKGTPVKKAGTAAYVQELVDDDFFGKQKTIADVKAELENRGHHIPITSLSGPLQRLCQRRILRRSRAKGATSKQQYAYSNW
jgi:membrane protein involved in colicin uptake